MLGLQCKIAASDSSSQLAPISGTGNVPPRGLILSVKARNSCRSWTAYAPNENDVAPLYVAIDPVSIAQSREDRSVPVTIGSCISGSSAGLVPPVSAPVYRKIEVVATGGICRPPGILTIEPAANLYAMTSPIAYVCP